jgi:hypothetical protein
VSLRLVLTGQQEENTVDAEAFDQTMWSSSENLSRFIHVRSDSRRDDVRVRRSANDQSRTAKLVLKLLRLLAGKQNREHADHRCLS